MRRRLRNFLLALVDFLFPLPTNPGPFANWPASVTLIKEPPHSDEDTEPLPGRWN